jgi:hypothetical protein
LLPGPQDSRCHPRFGADAASWSARCGPVGVGEALVAEHGHDVVEVLVVEPAPQSWVVAVGFVGGEPPHRLPAVLGEQPLQHVLGQLRLGGELDLFADPGLSAPVAILGPGGRQVQPPVDQRSPARRDLGQEHSQLAILDPPGGAGVLSLYARGLGSL